MWLSLYDLPKSRHRRFNNEVQNADGGRPVAMTSASIKTAVGRRLAMSKMEVEFDLPSSKSGTTYRIYCWGYHHRFDPNFWWEPGVGLFGGNLLETTYHLILGRSLWSMSFTLIRPGILPMPRSLTILTVSHLRVRSADT